MLCCLEWWLDWLQNGWVLGQYIERVTEVSNILIRSRRLPTTVGG